MLVLPQHLLGSPLALRINISIKDITGVKGLSRCDDLNATFLLVVVVDDRLIGRVIRMIKHGRLSRFTLINYANF